MKDKLQSNLTTEIDRLASFLQKSYKARVKWAKTGGWNKAIQAEIGGAVALGRLDLVANLMERHSRITVLTTQIAEIEYSERFANLEPSETLPSEIIEPSDNSENKDSTQFVSETKKGFADIPKQ